MTPEAPVDYYRVLGVNRDASVRQIRKAYRTWMRRIHPDHNPDPDALPFDAPDITLVNKAWSVLRDPTRRAAYNASLGDAPETLSDELQSKLPRVPEGFELHPRPRFWSTVSLPHWRAADAVRGALSLSAFSGDLSGLSSLRSDQLWWLDASDRPVTDADLRHLARFKRLEFLALDNSAVTDAGLLCLRDLPELRSITLSACDIGDPGAQLLASLRTLQNVELDETSVSDAGISAFARHPELTTLDVRKTKVGGDGLATLTDLPKLRELRVNSRLRRKADDAFRHRPEVHIV